MISGRFPVIGRTCNVLGEVAQDLVPVHDMASCFRMVCQPLVQIVSHDYINASMRCNCFSDVGKALRCLELEGPR